MKVSGEATLHGPVDKVYATLHDPAVLVRTIPGCERLEAIGPDAYRMVLTAGVASVKGTYTGEVALSEQEAPHGFRLTASGSGAPGTVSTDVRVRLTEGSNGTTVLSYDADAVVGGPVGGVGQRILAGVARKTANEFFAAVDDVLTGAEPAAQPVAGEPVPAAQAVPAGQVAQAGQAVPAAGTTFVRPPGPARRGMPDLAVGVALGAAAALLGVFVGALVTRRGRGRS